MSDRFYFNAAFPLERNRVVNYRIYDESQSTSMGVGGQVAK